MHRAVNKAVNKVVGTTVNNAVNKALHRSVLTYAYFLMNLLRFMSNLCIIHHGACLGRLAALTSLTGATGLFKCHYLIMY